MSFRVDWYFDFIIVNDLHKYTEQNGRNMFRDILGMLKKFCPDPKINPFNNLKKLKPITQKLNFKTKYPQLNVIQKYIWILRYWEMTVEKYLVFLSIIKPLEKQKTLNSKNTSIHNIE